jgi:hypothetical protein
MSKVAIAIGLPINANMGISRLLPRKRMRIVAACGRSFLGLALRHRKLAAKVRVRTASSPIQVTRAAGVSKAKANARKLRKL